MSRLSVIPFHSSLLCSWWMMCSMKKWVGALQLLLMTALMMKALERVLFSSCFELFQCFYFCLHLFFHHLCHVESAPMPVLKSRTDFASLVFFDMLRLFLQLPFDCSYSCPLTVLTVAFWLFLQLPFWLFLQLPFYLVPCQTEWEAYKKSPEGRK